MHHDANRPKIALADALETLGRNAWYTTLHEQRFLTVITTLTQAVSPDGHVPVLDVGVWPGYLTRAFAQLGYRVTGLDLNLKRLNQEYFPQVRLTQRDLDHTDGLPWPPQSFMAVVASEVLEHLKQKNLLSFLRESYRVTKQDGYLIVTTPNRGRIGRWFHRPATADASGHGHELEPTLPELVRLVHQAGWEVQLAKSVAWYADIGRSGVNNYYTPLSSWPTRPRRLANLLKWLAGPIIKNVPTLRDSLMIVARRP